MPLFQPGTGQITNDSKYSIRLGNAPSNPVRDGIN